MWSLFLEAGKVKHFMRTVSMRRLKVSTGILLARLP